MATCGKCKNFIKIPDVACGKCKVQKFIKTRSGRETNREFMPYRSRTACKQFFEAGKTITQYDKIKKMNLDETAEFLMDWFMRCSLGQAPMNVKAWLESEAE